MNDTLLNENTEQPAAESGSSAPPCSVLLDHDQIAFLRECIGQRREAIPKDGFLDAMEEGYVNGVNAECDEMLSLIGPCSTVEITPPNSQDKEP